MFLVKEKQKELQENLKTISEDKTYQIIVNYILKIIFWSINWLILAIYGIFSPFQRSISGKQIFILMCIVSVLHGIFFYIMLLSFLTIPLKVLS